MINLSDCIELGVLGKPHGIKGHIVLKLKNLSFEDIQEMELVFILIDGLPVPFFVEEFSERTDDSILIKIDTILSETHARKYSDLKVYINKKNLSIKHIPDLPIDNIIGYTVIDKQFGTIGKLDTVLNFDSNSVIRIIDGKIEILLPLQAEFILSINDSKQEIIVNCPEGLLDLYK